MQVVNTKYKNNINKTKQQKKQKNQTKQQFLKFI